MAASRLPAVIDWLLANITPLVPLVDVTEGWPGDKIQRTTIVIGAATISQDWRMQGARRKREDISLAIWILTEKPGGTANDARTEVFNIASTLQALFSTVPGPITIASLVTSTTFTPTTYTPALGDNSRVGVLQCELRINDQRFNQ